MNLNRLLARTILRARDLYTYPCFECRHREPRYCMYRGRRCFNQTVRYRGVYPDYASAVAHLPAHQPIGFDNSDVVSEFADHFSSLNPNDYPVMLRLAQILRPGATVFDFGGGFGQCYYAYRKHIEFPSEMKWIVCDVDSFLSYGRDMAKMQQATPLAFTHDRHIGDGASVYLTNGALQYIEEDLDTILNKLPSKPPHVLVNRIPVYDGEAFFTLQFGAGSYSPYKVMNHRKFVTGMESIGYRKVDEWTTPRGLRVPFHPENTVSAYQGFYFTRA